MKIQTFEIRTLSDCYRIVKTVNDIEAQFSSEEKICEIKISKDSDQYCKIICEALNKKYMK